MPVNQETLVSVITRLENDADRIEAFVAEVSESLRSAFRYFEVVLVDNASTDDTEVRIPQLQQKYPNLHYLRLSRAYEAETAYTAGLENSLGDYVIVMDLRTDPPQDVLTLLRAAAEGFDVVIGVRTSNPEESFLRRICGRALYRAANACLAFPLRGDSSFFRCLSRQVVNSITRIRNKSRSLRYMNAVVGYRQICIPYTPRAGKDNWRAFLRSVRSTTNLVISNSAVPLRVASLLGLSASFLNLLYFGYILTVALVKRTVMEGWITTNSVMTLLFLILFLILTILAEYIARLLQEVEDRPLYFVEYDSYSSVTFFKKELADRFNVE